MQLYASHRACGSFATSARRSCVASARRVAAAASTAQQQLQQEQALPLPRDVDTMVIQAAGAVQRAQEAAGSQRVIVELINAVNEKASSFMSTEAMDYPCSNMKEFETIVGQAKALLRRLLGDDAAELTTTRIDEGGIDGDLCATVRAGSVMAVVWPTAEKLKYLKELAQEPSIKLLLVVNPLWKTEGNLVSELGFGPWRKANEEFLATFERAYFHYEQRIGAPSSVDIATGTRYVNGAVLRVLRAFPGLWVAHVVAADGTSQAIGGFEDKPSYQQLEALVDSARKAKMEIFALARKASSLDREQGVTPSNIVQLGGGEAAFYSPAEVADMDPKQLRRVLVGLGLPGAGTPQKLLQRAQAVAEAAAGGASLSEAVEVARRLR